MAASRQALGIVLLALLAGAAGLWLGARQDKTIPLTRPNPAQDARRQLVPGEAIPAIRLPDRDGRVRALAEWQGRPLLINFWAPWCSPCIEEMPLLDAFAAREAANGVQVVGIALDEPAAVERFLGATPVAYPILLDRVAPDDSSAQLGNALGVLPYSVLVDASGRVLAQKAGPFRGDELSRWTAESR